MQQTTSNWEASTTVVQKWHHATDCIGVWQFRIDVMHPHCNSSLGGCIALVIGMEQIQYATLTQHGVANSGPVRASPKASPGVYTSRGATTREN